MMNSHSVPYPSEQAKFERRQIKQASIFQKKLVISALRRSIVMLDPRAMVKNPVMFVTEAGAVLTTLIAGVNAMSGVGHQLYTVTVMLILWLTVMFSNFAEALAEARGKAQAESLKRTRQNTVARRVSDGKEESVNSDKLQEGDRVIVLTGEIIPGDGEIIEGWWRSIRSCRRNTSYLGLYCCSYCRFIRALLSRQNDFPRRGGCQAENAQ
jgi:potassium-transporting ATPase ATP-binding subunit